MAPANRSGPSRYSLRPTTWIIIAIVFIITCTPYLVPKSSSFPGLFPSSSSSKSLNPPSSSLDLPLTLEARLSYLLSRPVLEQWEAELSNRYNCPFYTYSRNTYFFHHQGNEEKWRGVGKDEIRKYRNKMVEYLRGVERAGGSVVWDESLEKDTPVDQRRGIIMTGGDVSGLPRLKMSLRTLRNVVGCRLPIEIYHFQDELQDARTRAELEGFNVNLKSVKDRAVGGEKSWNIKNVAFITSGFTEFIYMDSDNIPLRDPAELFESVEYKQSGSVFWSDLNKDHPDNAIFRILGRTCSDAEWPAEAGEVVFDKRGNNGLNLAVVHLAHHMMAETWMYEFLSYGDKDTFRYSFYALGLPWQMAPRLFASAGGYQDQQGKDGDFCGHSMIQWGLTPPSEALNPSYHPPPAFLHTILSKNRPGLQPSKVFSHIRHPRLDSIREPSLVRIPYDFTGSCFSVEIKGPDGELEGSVMDGQGLVEDELKNVVGKEFWGELEKISEEFVRINH